MSLELVSVVVNGIVGLALFSVAGVTLWWRFDERRRESYVRDRDWAQSDVGDRKIVVNNVRNQATKSVELQVWMPKELKESVSAGDKPSAWLKDFVLDQCTDDEVSFYRAEFDFKSWSQIVHAAKRENKVANRFIADLLKMKAEKD